jgi:hypothetical protein
VAEFSLAHPDANETGKPDKGRSTRRTEGETERGHALCNVFDVLAAAAQVRRRAGKR